MHLDRQYRLKNHLPDKQNHLQQWYIGMPQQEPDRHLR